MHSKTRLFSLHNYTTTAAATDTLSQAVITVHNRPPTKGRHQKAHKQFSLITQSKRSTLGQAKNEFVLAISIEDITAVDKDAKEETNKPNKRSEFQTTEDDSLQISVNITHNSAQLHTSPAFHLAHSTDLGEDGQTWLLLRMRRLGPVT
ncbi:hypothetical protein BaRGS_00033101 [Batillaria attramentaria]|uniref:Uncharacterized protein n=1 Tax=Batillaria attramentaria TaxID=370345 RepID=A0ABD0JLV0_9CAEN